ncbi:MAG: ATP-binding cassette domain-containing protein [Phototrophicaceae bacterium]
MIEAKALTKRYGVHLALDGVTFNAAPGEILGLLGPNGAGKTTTMRILTGYMPPSSGTATVAGFDVLDDSMEVRRRVGYMPERVPIYPDMTVQGYVMFWARLRGVRKAKARVDEVLERVRLTERRNSLLRNLSKGLVQRLGLAQALVHEPDVVILDEPTIGIDPQQVIEVREYVRQLGRDHTVLFSTHILSEAEQVCDRVVIINKGRLMAEGKPEALRRQLDPGDHIYVMVRGEVKRVRGVLEKIAGVERVETNGPGFSVRAKKGTDVRARIAEGVAAANLPLIEMRPVAMTLEDIFLDIVGREG